MIFYTLKTKDNEYKCKISARGLCNLEDKLGENPLNMFMTLQAGQMPKMSLLLTILHESMLQYNHGITFDDVNDIYDAYIEDGHNLTDFMLVIVDILRVSGIIPSEEEPAKAKKGKTSAKN